MLCAHTPLLGRQGGRIVERIDKRTELCYFQYSSPVFFVSGRDTCYVKVRRDLPGGGFILSYRSIHHDVRTPLIRFASSGQLFLLCGEYKLLRNVPRTRST
jgi:hypothetical protein